MPDEPMIQAIKHLRAIHTTFGEAATNMGVQEHLGPVEQIAARYGALGFFQVEGILTLAEANDKLHMQVGQLVRGLLEAWFYTAWMLAPETPEGRRRRVNCLERNGVTTTEQSSNTRRRSTRRPIWHSLPPSNPMRRWSQRK